MARSKSRSKSPAYGLKRNACKSGGYIWVKGSSKRKAHCKTAGKRSKRRSYKKRSTRKSRSNKRSSRSLSPKQRCVAKSGHSWVVRHKKGSKRGTGYCRKNSKKSRSRSYKKKSTRKNNKRSSRSLSPKQRCLSKSGHKWVIRKSTSGKRGKGYCRKGSKKGTRKGSKVDQRTKRANLVKRYAKKNNIGYMDAVKSLKGVQTSELSKIVRGQAPSRKSSTPSWVPKKALPKVPSWLPKKSLPKAPGSKRSSFAEMLQSQRKRLTPVSQNVRKPIQPKLSFRDRLRAGKRSLTPKGKQSKPLPKVPGSRNSKLPSWAQTPKSGPVLGFRQGQKSLPV